MSNKIEYLNDGWWNFLIKAAIRGANDLRKNLHTDESGFRRVAGYSHADARSYYLYSVLNEVQKAGIALMRWKELFKEEDNTSDDDQISRVILESILEEQSLWLRKLCEALVSLICFNTTNENDYYRHFLLLTSLDNYLSDIANLKDFYNCPSKNLEYSIHMFKKQIAEIEDKINLNHCWYLQDKRKLSSRKKLNPGKILSSMRNRMKFALPLCTNGEKVSLGLSYEYYSSTSEDIHFKPYSSKLYINKSLTEIKSTHMGLLILHILLRCQKLLKTVPKGINEQLIRVFKKNAKPKSLKMLMDTKIEVGDFVLAYGYLAEVLEVKVSSYGYRCYKVLYLNKRPIPEIEEDFFPAQNVRLLFRTQDISDEFKRIVGNRVKSITAKEAQEFMRKSVIKVWKDLNLKEYLKIKKKSIDKTK